jgi:cellulose synthase/poly-beta-1,6-N-acetylglucosamine synthase-like glycosyltransferase
VTSIVLIALLVLGYTFAGYPLLAALRSRWSPHPIHPVPEWEPTVSVLMSAHDAASSVEAKLENVSSLDWPRDKLEILVYSDGSSDETAELVARAAERDPRIALVRSERRSGKPTGLNRLRALARGEVLLLTDVRPRLERGALRALVAALADPEVACVSGNLELLGAAGSGAYWRYEKLIRNAEGRSKSLVGVTGAVYAIRARDFPELPPDLILDDMWIPLTAALRTRRRIAFVEDARAYDDAFEDDREFGRKVRTLAGNFQLIQKLPILLDPAANPLWFEITSHKLLRLVCPFFLLVLLASSAAAFATARSSAEELALGAVLVGQLGFYGLAALGSRAGRVARLARSFVVLNAAAVVGLWRFARGSQKVTW